MTCREVYVLQFEWRNDIIYIKCNLVVVCYCGGVGDDDVDVVDADDDDGGGDVRCMLRVFFLVCV